MKRARLMPKVSEWASELSPAVEAIPSKPRTTTGQHQDPIRAGTDKTSIKKDTITLLREASAGGGSTLVPRRGATDQDIAIRDMCGGRPERTGT